MSISSLKCCYVSAPTSVCHCGFDSKSANKFKSSVMGVFKSSTQGSFLRFRSKKILKYYGYQKLHFWYPLWKPSSAKTHPAQIHTVDLRCCNLYLFSGSSPFIKYNFLLFANKTFTPLSPQTHSECVCRINQCPVRPSSSVVSVIWSYVDIIPYYIFNSTLFFLQ